MITTDDTIHAGSPPQGGVTTPEAMAAGSPGTSSFARTTEEGVTRTTEEGVTRVTEDAP